MTANNKESGMHQAEEELAKWIGLYQQVQLPGSDESWSHRHFADLVAVCGRFFRAVPWPLLDSHPRRQGQCFQAANEWADRQGWIYVEGFAFLPAAPAFMSVIDHAWCLTEDGHVADPALEDGQAEEYFGVPVTNDFRRQQRMLRGTDALFTADPTNPIAGYATHILRHGIPPTALTFFNRIVSHTHRVTTAGVQVSTWTPIFPVTAVNCGFTPDRVEL